MASFYVQLGEEEMSDEEYKDRAMELLADRIDIAGDGAPADAYNRIVDRERKMDTEPGCR